MTLGGADDAVGLGGDQALMVHGQKRERFKQLRLDRGRAHDDHRLFREDGRALGHGVNVAAEVEVCKIVEEFLAEDTSPAQVVDVLLVEVQILDIVDQLLQTRRDGKAAFIGHLPEEHVEGRQVPLVGFEEVAVRHCQLIEVHDHRDVPSVAHAHLIAGAWPSGLKQSAVGTGLAVSIPALRQGLSALFPLILLLAGFIVFFYTLNYN